MAPAHLREAVNNAIGDSDSTGGDCAAGESGSDTIEISSSVNTITIASRLDIRTFTGNDKWQWRYLRRQRAQEFQWSDTCPLELKPELEQRDA